MSSSAITGPIFSDVRRSPSGSAAAPSWAFNESTGTGIYLVSAGVLGLSTNGAQRVVVDASGNVGIGTASPAEKMQVIGTVKASSFDFTGASTGVRGVVTTTSAVRTLSSDGTSYGYGISTNIAGGLDIMANQASQDIRFYCGTSNASPSERMRIDASGNLLVGNTTGTAALDAAKNNSTTCRIKNTRNQNGDQTVILQLGSNTNNTSSYFIVAQEEGVANRFFLYGNGTYGTVSDRNLKKNIESARDGYLEDVMKLRVVKYNWNTQEDGEPKELGWIAQELAEVFPGLVQDSQPKEDGSTTKEVKTSVLPFILLKAIQEQQEIIGKLEARLAALESKP